MSESDTNRLVEEILGGRKPTKSILCAVLAFIEAVHEELERNGSSSLEQIRDREVIANGIRSQGTRAPDHLKRHKLPFENYRGDKSGRKTPEARNVIPRLVEHLVQQGFDRFDPRTRVQMLNNVSSPFLRKLSLSLGPIKVNPAGMSTAAVVEEILTQASERGLASAIAELLVGAKLEVCCGDKVRRAIATQHKWENGSDEPEALGDYRVDRVAIEVTIVERPDDTHRRKANQITHGAVDQCWLIVRSDQMTPWQKHLAAQPSKYPGLIRCFGICEFVGQNLTETAWRSHDPDVNPLRDVVAKLNELTERLGPQYQPSARVDLVD